MGDKTYNRIKDPSINATTMAISGEARELPNALAAIAAGTTGNFEVAVSADADGGGAGGPAIQQLYRVALFPNIGQADPGAQRLAIEVTPVLGDGTDGETIVLSAEHPETMSAWQTAAGFPPVA